MRRDQLEHAIRTACQITGQTEVIVIGSQAILGTYPEYELPHLATRSMEVYILPITEVTAVEQRPDGATVTWRDSAGELTQTVGGCVIALPAQAARRNPASISMRGGPNISGRCGAANS